MDWRAEVEAARQMVAIHETLRMPGAAHPHRVIVEIGNALDAAERDRDEARAMLGELLARVHRDGGHRADAAGLAQATREADEIIARLMAERGEARAEVDRLRSRVTALETTVSEALLIAHTAPPPVHAAHWCLRLVETLRNALTTDGAP